MSKSDSERKNSFSDKKRYAALAMAALNVALLAVAILLYGRYTAMYQEGLRKENLVNIANLNQSSAINATAVINSWNAKLNDIARFVERREATLEEALQIIDDANSSSERYFEIIADDYTGYLVSRDENGAYIPLSYQGSSYASLQKAFDDVRDEAYGDICFAPEFTDGASALKYFAVYRHISLLNETGGKEKYTLMLATKSSDMLAVFNKQTGFEGKSSVLIDAKGDYIVSSGDFKSTNFFQYLYVYNDLSLDKRKEIENEIALSGSGEVYYKNAVGEDCVFRYERMATNNWYCITCVPISSFRTPIISINYAAYAVIALLLMLGSDIAWLRYMNTRLLASMMREKEASDAKTDFLSRMSHDIRTPLNGIIGLTSLALYEDNSPRMREYLENIKVSGQFLSGLVNDILDLSKVESGKVELHPEPYSDGDLRKYVEAVVSPLCRDKGLKFVVTQPSDSSYVLLDRLRFNQVLFNLLSNAVKYTPPGGLVELFWSRSCLESGLVSLDITVRDNGIGMSEEFQRHMFDSFTQEREQTAATGVGLGLSIVNSLVKIMNGTIEVESRQGVGSTFTVHLETRVCEGARTDSDSGPKVSIEGKRALLCEDNRINSMVVQRMLARWKMSVDAAENGREGLEKFKSSAPGTYDVILMDVMMPEMNGLDATRAIRAMKDERPEAAEIPVIAMTANAYDSDIKNCLEAGMTAYIGKPVDGDRFKALIEKYAGARNDGESA